REKGVVGHVADEQLNGPPGVLLPDLQSLGKRTDGGQGFHPELMVPSAAREVVDNGNLVPFRRQVQGRGPAAITVASQHSNLHVCASAPILVRGICSSQGAQTDRILNGFPTMVARYPVTLFIAQRLGGVQLRRAVSRQYPTNQP